MSSTLTIDGKEYVTAVIAGKKFGYTKDYFLMLAKQGKIDGQKVGNKWYINLSSAELFFNDAEKKKFVRSEKIRAERKAELALHKRVKGRTEQKSFVKAALVETLVIVVIGLSLGVTGYLGTTSNVASTHDAEYGFFENLAISLYEFFSPQTTVVEEHVAVPAVQEAETDGQITHTSIVVAPDEVFTATTIESVQESFSDEVEISVDPDNPSTGIIIPKFRDKDGESYRFLMVPVHESTQ